MNRCFHGWECQKNHSAVDYLWNVLYDCRRLSWSDIYAATVNWVTQSLFKPINVAVSTKADSHTNDITKIDVNFARNVMGKGQLGAACAFSNWWSWIFTQAKLLANISLIHSGMTMYVIKFNKLFFNLFFMSSLSCSLIYYRHFFIIQSI